MTTEARELTGTQPETPLDRPTDPPVVERGLIILPDGTELSFGFDVYTQRVQLPRTDVAVIEAAAVVPVAVAPPTHRQLAAAALRRLRARAVETLESLRRATDWLADGLRPAGAATAAWRRRVRYEGRHHVTHRWFGRERSTAEVTGAYHRNYRAGADLMEVDLPVPVYWVSWTYRIMEILRLEYEALHPTVGHRFICS